MNKDNGLHGFYEFIHMLPNIVSTIRKIRVIRY
jgi:hypothetical protein